MLKLRAFGQRKMNNIPYNLKKKEKIRLCMIFTENDNDRKIIIN